MQTSIIIPVFNGARFLRAAVQSLLREAIADLEIIVIDDGSTDQGLAVVRDLPGLVLHSQKRQGAAMARNTGLALAHGDLIGFLDQDDELAPGGLRWRVDYLENNFSELGVCGAIAGIIDAEGKSRGSYADVFQVRKGIPPERMDRDYVRRRQEPVNLWRFLFRRELIERVGPVDPKTVMAEDLDYCYRVLGVTSLPYVDRPTVFYRLHDHNLSIGYENGRPVQNRQNFAEAFLVDRQYEDR